MVRFEKDKFIIEVVAPSSGVDNWRLTFDQMIDLLQADVREEPVNKFFFLELMREMLPDEETISQMQTNLNKQSND